MGSSYYGYVELCAYQPVFLDHRRCSCVAHLFVTDCCRNAKVRHDQQCAGSEGCPTISWASVRRTENVRHGLVYGEVENMVVGLVNIMSPGDRYHGSVSHDLIWKSLCMNQKIWIMDL